jgi:hypothetical protein
MKRFIFASFLLGLISCSSCVKKNDTVINPIPTLDASVGPDLPDVHVDKRVHVAGDTWEFYLPSQAWGLEFIDGSPDTVYYNPQDKNLVVFVKEPVDISSQEYVLFAIRALKESGLSLLESSLVQINGVTYNLLEAGQGSVRLFQWISVKNKVGYSISCGGPTTSFDQATICSGIANTLVVK